MTHDKQNHKGVKIALVAVAVLLIGAAIVGGVTHKSSASPTTTSPFSAGNITDAAKHVDKYLAVIAGDSQFTRGTYANADLVIMGQSVCNYLDQGMSPNAAEGQVVNQAPALTGYDASFIVGDAAGTLCTQHLPEVQTWANSTGS